MTLFGKGVLVDIICIRISRLYHSGLGWALKPNMGVLIRDSERHTERNDGGRERR